MGGLSINSSGYAYSPGVSTTLSTNIQVDIRVTDALGQSNTISTIFTGGPWAGPRITTSSEWNVYRAIHLEGPWSGEIASNGDIYVGRRSQGTRDGLYRIDQSGRIDRMSELSNPAAVAIEPSSGDVYFDTDYAGVIYKHVPGTFGATTWVSGFHSGDDDPAGMAFNPPGVTDPLLGTAGAIVVDRGSGGPDELWRYSTSAAQGETLLIPDGFLTDAVDVAVSADGIFIADTGTTAGGSIFHFTPSGLVPIPTPTVRPVAIDVDPISGDLYVLDYNTNSLRVFDTSGTERPLAADFGGRSWAGVDFSADGSQMILVSYHENVVWVLQRTP